MKSTAQIIAQLAQDNARSYIRGQLEASAVINAIGAMRGEIGPKAAALYALEFVSYLPDGAEAQFREALKGAVE